MKRGVCSAAAAAVVLASCGVSPSSGHAEERAWADRIAWARYARAAPDEGAAASLDEQAEAVQAMIDHHQDAIDGTRLFLNLGADDPIVARFAERLIRVQTAEVEQMEAWLAAHPDADPGDDEHWLAICSTGAATRSDVGFLNNMIVHHLGAVGMYETFIARDVIVDDDIGRLMRRISLAQIGEIEWMKQQVAALDGV